MTSITDEAATAISANINGVRDALSTRRVFGDPYEVDGVTFIPVAHVSGTAGGGGGESIDDDEPGGGFGTGFGLSARPVGIYAIRDGRLEWNPTIDTTRIVNRCVALAGVAAVCATALLLRRR